MAAPRRLVDYIAIVDLDPEQFQYDTSNGIVSQRFPTTNWDDIAFSNSIQMFCQPWGWRVSVDPSPSTFFVNTLTDIMGDHQYACCLQRQERCNVLDVMDHDISGGAPVYRPKVYVILSRNAFFPLFMECLRKISSAHMSGQVDVAEHMIATLLSDIILRPGADVSFNLGEERLALHVPNNSMLPISTGCASLFARSLGLHNLLIVMRAILCDQKIVFVSSYCRMLSAAGQAITSLLYPFEYSYTYVPVLPEPLLEYLESPTPFLMGVMRNCLSQVPSSEVVVVDLDTGAVTIPNGVIIPEIPEPFASRLLNNLQSILLPELKYMDLVDAPPAPPKPDGNVLDSQLRACFIQFYSEILEGYRWALLLVRLFPSPLIAFHRAAFVGLRGLQYDAHADFLHGLLGSHMFQLFISTRGLPYRSCDVFDSFVSQGNDVRRRSDDRMKELAAEIFHNEHQRNTSCQAALRNGTVNEEATTSSIPPLDEQRIEILMKRKSVSTHDNEGSEEQKRRVPETPLPLFDDECTETRKRRLQALEEYFSAVFDNRISEARKKKPAIEFALRTRSVRVRLCALLVDGMQPVHRATLHPQQFELIVHLINCALENETVEDEHGIAYACLYFSYVYCRRLTQGVQQYMYTCIQEHAVWENERFWEAAFFHDVHRLMRRQYMNVTYKARSDEPHFKVEGTRDTWGLLEQPTAMDIAAKRLEEKEGLSEEELDRLAAEEESIVFGQAKHYINLMIFLRVPLDSDRLRKIEKEKEEKERGRRNSTDDSDNESGFVESSTDSNATVVKWITRVIDRISCAAGLNARLIENLIQLIGPCVGMHVDTLEQVYRESRKLPPPPRLEIAPPELLPHEHGMIGSMRAILLPNERSPSTLQYHSVSHYLPAEGELFLTNYRIVFKGHPINPLASDELIIRGMPVMSLVKEKFLPEINSSSWQMESISVKVAARSHNCVQFRSSTFAKLTVIFDEDVSEEKVAELFRCIKGLRWPVTIPSTLFCYAGKAHLLQKTMTAADTNKMSSIKEFRRAIINLPKKGIPATLGRRKDSHTLDSRLDGGGRSVEDYLEISDLMGRNSSIDLLHAEYLGDLRRLRFNADHGLFKISDANASYEIAPSYPSFLTVPCSTNDETLVKIAKGFKSGRFPVVTWVNEKGALLIRGSALSTQNVTNKIKRKAKELGNDDKTSLNSFAMYDRSPSLAATTPITSTAHQEHYIRRLAASSPTASNDLFLQSFNSLGHSSDSLHSSIPSSSIFPSSEVAKKASIDFAKSATQFVRNTSVRSTFQKTSQTMSISSTADERTHSDAERSARSLIHRNLYIFGEKGHSKVLRLDRNVEFIPIAYPTAHDMKDTFKRFSRVLRQDQAETVGKAGFIRLLDESEWMKNVSVLLELSSCIAVLLSTANSSAMLCIEDGTDATCQISSLVQLLCDPHYRTIKGFQDLIAKEWLAFGHRFSYRHNQTLASQKSGYAPVFLLFLDAVHQITKQYPSAFEFNDFFLRFLAYHSQSTFFRTFIFNCESERVHTHHLVPDTEGEHCIWRFIQSYQDRKPLFTNFLFDPSNSEVLEIRWSTACLELWEYYTEDFILHGPPYDIECSEKEQAAREEVQAKLKEAKTTKHDEPSTIKVDLFSCRDLRPVNGFAAQIERISAISPLVSKSGKASSWKQHLNQVESSLESDVEEDSKMVPLTPVRSSANKKLLMKYLMMGKNTITTSTPNHPNIVSITPAFPRLREETERNGSVGGRIAEEDSSTLRATEASMSPPSSLSMHSDTHVIITNGNRARSPDETTTPTKQPKKSLPPLHSGILCKKGATFKFWKPRWFVLEARTHKLVYFDSPHDPQVRGEIDLGELQSIDVISGVNHIPRKGTAVIDIRTLRRSYSLLANSKAEADMWRDKIASLL